jgi:PAS domain S-box-containing protein
VKILIADDNTDNLYYLEVMLKGAGHEVISARNGREALDRLSGTRCDLIISDILMPAMDGFQLCRECKKREDLGAIPFIFYTATYTDEKDRKLGLGIGADEYLIKPMEPDKLLGAIDRVLAAAAGRRGEAFADEEDYLTEYNRRLIAKLEKKMAALEESTRELERQVVERRQAEEALNNERLKLKTLSDNAPFGMVLIDNKGRYTYMNSRFRDMFGYDLSDIPDGRTWFRRVYPDDRLRQEAITTWKEEIGGLSRGERKLKVFAATCADGSQKMVNFIPLKLASGDYLVTCEDITELKKLERQLHQSQKMEAIGSLAGGIAHDFNNILTTLMGYAGLLQMEMDRHDPLGLYVEQIISASQKAANLTRSLLAFSRQQPIVLNPVNINDTIRSTEKLLKRLLTEDVDFRVSLQPQDMVIMADATQIDQILFNLVANARDAMPKGGKLLIATSQTDIDERFVHTHGYGKPGAYAMVIVSDTGTGMDEATKEKIFDPFFSTKEVGRGTGLGLSTVYGIVKQHDGFINVYSEPGKGTTFRIYLPLVSFEVPREEPPEPVMQRGTETILVAEDNADLRRLVTKVLVRHGYRTIEAVDGEDAIDKHGKNKGIDLIIVDSVMPKKNGREVYEEIRKVDPGVAFLFTSGHTRDTILNRGIADSEFDFLPKPIAPFELLQMVRKVLDRKKTA